jgi:hypothetical protein
MIRIIFPGCHSWTDLHPRHTRSSRPPAWCASQKRVGRARPGRTNRFAEIMVSELPVAPVKILWATGLVVKDRCGVERSTARDRPRARRHRGLSPRTPGSN